MLWFRFKIYCLHLKRLSKQQSTEGPTDMAGAKIDSSLELQFKTKYLNLTFSQPVLPKTFGTIEYEYRIGTLF